MKGHSGNLATFKMEFFMIQVDTGKLFFNNKQFELSCGSVQNSTIFQNS